MNILTWIVLGLIAGAGANALDPRPAKGGIVSAIVLGIVGAIVGGYLGSMLFGIGVSGLDIRSILVSIAGAFGLLFAARALYRSA